VQQDQQEMVKQARLAHKDLQVPEAVQVLKVQQELY
jgi:hypothetical protein